MGYSSFIGFFWEGLIVREGYRYKHLTINGVAVNFDA